MTINTSQFEFSHGRKPRGYGFWAFSFDRYRPEIDFQFHGNYGDALKAAKAEAKRLGAYSITVLS